MKVAEVDTQGVQRESQDEEAPLTGSTRRGYDALGGSSPRNPPAATSPKGPPSWFWAGVLLLALGFVIVLASSGGDGGDSAADSSQLAQISAELDAISATQEQLATTTGGSATSSGPSPAQSAATASELAAIRGQLSQIAADQQQFLAAPAPAAVPMPAGHDRLCAFGVGQPASSQLRLPSVVVPKHYHWTLTPGVSPLRNLLTPVISRPV